MIRKTVSIENMKAHQNRPLAMLVQVTCHFTSDVFIESGSKCVNAKSLLGIMALGLDDGDSVTVQTEGPDEEEALCAIENYLTGMN